MSRTPTDWQRQTRTLQRARQVLYGAMSTLEEYEPFHFDWCDDEGIVLEAEAAIIVAVQHVNTLVGMNSMEDTV